MSGAVCCLLFYGSECRSLLKQFLTMEVIPWQALQQEYAADMAAETDVFSDPKGREDLQLRVVEHVRPQNPNFKT